MEVTVAFLRSHPHSQGHAERGHHPCVLAADSRRYESAAGQRHYPQGPETTEHPAVTPGRPQVPHQQHLHQNR